MRPPEVLQGIRLMKFEVLLERTRSQELSQEEAASDTRRRRRRRELLGRRHRAA